MNPGATTLSGIPAPAHSGLTATLRHHRFKACLALPYRSRGPFPAAIASFPAAIAVASSMFRQASTIRGSVGLNEAIEDTSTARGAGLFFSSGRNPSSVATAPKKLTASMVSAGPPPAFATIASIFPPESRVTPSISCATACAGGQIRDHIRIVKIAGYDAIALFPQMTRGGCADAGSSASDDIGSLHDKHSKADGFRRTAK